jgi:hypothetical protein
MPAVMTATARVAIMSARSERVRRWIVTSYLVADQSESAPIVDLAQRETSDLDVVLLWERRSGRLWVNVTHRRSGRTARIDATPRNAFDVFHHPLAYAHEAA